jgi:hypothetical protein
MVHDAWCVMHGVHGVHDAWCVVHGAWRLLCVVWFSNGNCVVWSLSKINVA